MLMLLAAELLPSDLLGNALKAVQIVFYIIAGIVAVLTYRAAVKGWLTPTNTEYQKRVIDRLAKLSEGLFAEFDPTSENYWPTIKPVHAAVEHINMGFENNRENVLAVQKWYFGTPVTQDVQRLDRLLRPMLSDPFIPENIRAAVVDLLENRLHVLGGIYLKELEKYAGDLAKGKHSPLTELDDVNQIHNKCVEQMHKQGCGIATIEAAVHDIRGLIQDYFDSFILHAAKIET